MSSLNRARTVRVLRYVVERLDYFDNFGARVMSAGLLPRHPPTDANLKIAASVDAFTLAIGDACGRFADQLEAANVADLNRCPSDPPCEACRRARAFYTDL